ncbi:MAG: hypothetical protein RH862_07935 [Leptospiraceae bacterium]
MRPGIRPYWPLALLIAFTLQSCMGGFYSRENKILDNYFAIYTIESDAYPDEELRAYMGQQQKFPRMKPSDLIQILGGFKFRKESMWGSDVRPVFDPAEVERFAGALARTIETIEENQRILIISRFDPDESVLSRMERTSMILWYDSNGLNLVFGEIKEPVPYDDFLTEDNWTEVLPISFRKSYPDLSLVSSDSFDYKRVGDYDHHTWAVLADTSMASLLERKQAPGFDASESYFSETSGEPKGSGPVDSEKTLSERLKQLEKAHKDGLITEQEYKEKRAEILDSF